VTSGIVGLDVGSNRVSVCVLAPDGSEATPRWDIANSQAGGDVESQLDLPVTTIRIAG